MTLHGSEPGAVLMKNQELGDGCGSEGPEGAGSVGCPPPPLSPPAEGRPAPSTGPPSAGPSWRGLGTPEETEVPHLQGTLGPTCDEEPGGRCGTWGVGGGRSERLLGGRGGASQFVTATLGQRDSRPGHAIVHSLASVSSSQIAQPPSGSPMRTGFTEAPTVCLHCAHSTPRPWAVTHPFFR